MKAIKILSLMLILAVGLTMAGNSNAEARGRGKKAWGPGSGMMGTHMLEKFATELQLTTEQKQEIAAIVAKYRVASQDKREVLWKAHSELMQKMLTEDLDEAAIRAEYQKIAAEREKLREERFVEKAKMLSEIKAVLTEDQLKLFQEKSTDWFQNKRMFYKHKKGDWHGGYKKHGHGGYKK